MKIKQAITLAALLSFPFLARAQELVFDPQHLAAVAENTMVRSSAESVHQDYLGKIQSNTNQTTTDLAAVLAAQQAIYHALADVSSALQGGLVVKGMAATTSDIYKYLAASAALARGQPQLASCAAGMVSQMLPRAAALSADVSAFVLRAGNNILMDYNARDELLGKIASQLRIIDGLAYGAYRAIYWARQRSLLTQVSPLAGWLSRDKNFAAQIIASAKYLKP
jgi:hypothetical protein